jgi:uncharacterized protein YabN with tetrapyrrole methylase and pyrophosphatase domain
MNVINKLQEINKQANDFGFKWPNATMALQQLVSECNEVAEVLEQNQGYDRLQEEVGDMLQAALELCLLLELDPHTTLDRAIDKFTKRFALLQEIAKIKGYETLANQPVESMISLWKQAKAL